MLERVSAQPRHLVKDFKLLTDIVASYRLQITDYRLQITDYRLQITDYKLQTTDYAGKGQRSAEIPGQGLQAAQWHRGILQVGNYRLRITDYKLQIMLERVSAQPRHLVKDFKLLTDIVASYRLQITDYKVQITENLCY